MPRSGARALARFSVRSATGCRFTSAQLYRNDPMDSRSLLGRGHDSIEPDGGVVVVGELRRSGRAMRAVILQLLPESLSERLAILHAICLPGHSGEANEARAA